MSEAHEEVLEQTKNPEPEPASTGNGVDPINSLATAEAAVESRARRMGWINKNEFKGGDTSRWVDAQTFIDRAESNANILIERNRALDLKLGQSQEEIQKQNVAIAALQRQLNDLTSVTTELRDFASSASQRAYKKARSDIEAEMRVAVSEADVPKFERAQQELRSLDEEAIDRGARRVETKSPEEPAPVVKPQPTVQEQPQPQIHPEVKAFCDANPWFMSDGTLNTYMQERHMAILREEPGLSLSENFAKAKSQVQAKFPEKFGINPRRNDAPAVTTTTTTRAIKSKKLGYDDLPAEAKAICDKFVKTIPPRKDKTTGTLVPYSREEYCLTYFGDQDEA